MNKKQLALLIFQDVHRQIDPKEVPDLDYLRPHLTNVRYVKDKPYELYFGTYDGDAGKCHIEQVNEEFTPKSGEYMVKIEGKIFRFNQIG